MKLLEKFWASDSKSPETGCINDDSVARILGDIILECSDLDNFTTPVFYTLLGTVVLKSNDENLAKEFLDALKEHNWNQVLSFQNWEGQADNLEAYAIRSLSEKILVLIIKRPFNIYETDSLLAYDLLDTVSAESLFTLINEKKWKPMISQ